MSVDHVRASIEAAEPYRRQLNGHDVEHGASTRTIPFRWASQIDDEAAGEIPEIVEDLLTSRGMSVMYGESNSGKSYLATHLSFCLVEQQPFLGKRVRGGAVIYIAAEGAGSIRQRVRAFRRHNHRQLRQVGLVETSLNLMDPHADVSALIGLIQTRAQEIGDSVVLVVVDTLARAMAGGDENSPQDMGCLVAAGDRIREATGAHVLFVHHSGKNALNGARGHSSLRAATDTELEVTKNESSKLHSIEVKKQRDLGSVGLTLTGRFVPVELGRNQWGNPITACIVKDTADVAPPPPPAKSKKLPKGSETAMEALRELIAASNRTSVATSAVPGGKRLVAVDSWRDRYYQRRGGDSDEPASTRRAEWNRAKKALIDAKLIGAWGEDAWMW